MPEKNAGSAVIVYFDDSYKTISTPSGWILCHEVKDGDAILVERFHNGSFAIGVEGDFFTDPSHAFTALENYLET